MTSIAWVFRANQDIYDLKIEAKDSLYPSAMPPKSVLIRVRAVSLNYRDIIVIRL